MAGGRTPSPEGEKLNTSQDSSVALSVDATSGDRTGLAVDPTISTSLARLRSADARLHQHERTATGEPIPSRKRLYSIGASPRLLAHAAPGVGVFLTTSFLLGVLTLLLSIASLYPFRRLQIPFVTLPKTWEAALPPAVPWLLVISSLLLPAGLLLIQQQQGIMAEHGHGLHWGRYTLLLRWSRGAPATNDELRVFCSHYGPVVSAVNILNAGAALRAGQQLAISRVRAAEVTTDASLPLIMRWSLPSAMYALFRRRFGGLGPATAAEVAARSTAERLEGMRLEPTGLALVTFAYPQHASNFLADHHIPLGGNSCVCCRGTRHTAPLIKGQRVHASRAPEPCDVLWEHAEVRGSWVWLGPIATAAAAAALLGLSFALQYAMAAAAQNGQKKRRFGNAITSSAFAALVVLMFQTALPPLLRRMVARERLWRTVRARDEWHTGILAVTGLLNGFVLPLGAALLLNNSRWYLRGGFAERMLYIQVLLVIVPPLWELLSPAQLMRSYVFSRYVRTQDALDTLLAGRPLRLVERYAAAIRTVGIAVLSTPMLPLSPLIALMGLTLSYWVDKFVALRRSPAPSPAPPLAGTSALAALLRVLPLVQLLLTWRLYLSHSPGSSSAFYTGLALWALLVLTPAAGPLWKALGIMHPKASSQGEPGLSLAAAVARAGPPPAPPSSHSQTQLPVGALGAPALWIQRYVPEVSRASSRNFRMRLFEAYAPPIQLALPPGRLLPGQDPATGGEAALPPREAAHMAAAAATTAAAGWRMSGRSGYGAYPDAEEGSVFTEIDIGAGGSRGFSSTARSEGGGSSAMRTPSSSPTRAVPLNVRFGRSDSGRDNVAEEGGAATVGGGIVSWGAAVMGRLRQSMNSSPEREPGMRRGAGLGVAADSISTRIPGASSPPQANTRYSTMPHSRPLTDIEMGDSVGLPINDSRQQSGRYSRTSGQASREITAQEGGSTSVQIAAQVGGRTGGLAIYPPVPETGFLPLSMGSQEHNPPTSRYRISNVQPHARRHLDSQRSPTSPTPFAAPPSNRASPNSSPESVPIPSGRRPPAQLYSNLQAAAEVQRQRRVQEEKIADAKVAAAAAAAATSPYD